MAPIHARKINGWGYFPLLIGVITPLITARGHLVVTIDFEPYPYHTAIDFVSLKVSHPRNNPQNLARTMT